MEGRNVLHARKGSSLLTTMPSNANNGLSKSKYAHTHTQTNGHTYSLESFNIVKGKWVVWVAVLRFTTSQLL